MGLSNDPRLQDVILGDDYPDESESSMDPQMTDEEYIASSLDTPNQDIEADDEEISRLLSTIVSEIDKQERVTRDRMLRLWKYLELLWSGAGNYYWDHMTGQWRAITQEDIALLSQEADIDPTLINKVINLIRPYGESLAGVLSTGTPRVKYFPEDADNDLDVLAARSYRNVEQKVNDDNFMTIKLIEIIVKLWNGGFAAAYNYSHSDPKYGQVDEPVYEDRPFETESLICTECGEETISDPREKLDKATEEEAPGITKNLDEDLAPSDEDEGEDEVPLPPMMMPDMKDNMCEECGAITPHISTLEDAGTKPVVSGMESISKSREIIEIYGPMNVKIPALATKEEDVIFLIKEEEKHVALARFMFPEHRKKIEAQTSSDLDIDRIARATYEVSDDTLRNYATIRWVWLRPAAFEILENEEDVEKLKTKYPTGVKAIFCAEDFLEAEEEAMDDHWTISINPLYPRIQADPLGKALIGLHESANDLFQLEIDTVRYSIPETFADPQFLDFEARAQSRALPGNISPMKRPPGGRLSDNLAETKTATIPKEVENLDAKIEKLLQFISGVLPSVFGGPATGSKTLGEYEQSKNQALQRLSIIWKVVSVLYARMMAKATKGYISNLREDENFVKEEGQGNYVNVWIRRGDFEGKIGEVRPELTEQFPSTWGQISARVMELLGLNNQIITSWFLHPENVETIYKALGIDELYIPGEDQRTKQLWEISKLIIEEPIVVSGPDGLPLMDPNTGQPMMQSSVQPEVIDDPEIHMAVIQAYLNSPMGIELKMTSPENYQNVMLHYQEHQMALIQQQQQAALTQGEEDTQASEEVQEG